MYLMMIRNEIYHCVALASGAGAVDLRTGSSDNMACGVVATSAPTVSEAASVSRARGTAGTHAVQIWIPKLPKAALVSLAAWADSDSDEGDSTPVPPISALGKVGGGSALD